MLVSRLALVDALNAPTTELRSQHRCVSSTANDAKNVFSRTEFSATMWLKSGYRHRPGQPAISQCVTLPSHVEHMFCAIIAIYRARPSPNFRYGMMSLPISMSSSALVAMFPSVTGTKPSSCKPPTSRPTKILTACYSLPRTNEVKQKTVHTSL